MFSLSPSTFIIWPKPIKWLFVFAWTFTYIPFNLFIYIPIINIVAGICYMFAGMISDWKAIRYIFLNRYWDKIKIIVNGKSIEDIHIQSIKLAREINNEEEESE